MRTPNRSRRRGAAALVGFVLIASACGGNDDGGTDDASPSSGSVADSDDVEIGNDDGDIVDTAVPGTEGEESEGDDASGSTDDSEIVDGSVDDPDATPRRGGTMRYGLEADVDGLNPTSSSLSSPGYVMGRAVFDTLTTATVDGEFVPYLAESVEPNDDFTSWTVKLRPGISFHDGTPLNAEAVVTNFRGQRSDPLVGLAVRPFTPDEGAVEVIDELTVRFNLLDSNRYFPGALSTQLGMVASPAWIEASLADPTLNQSPVGTGPFIFSGRSEDSVTSVVRNDDWWNGEVYLDGIDFVPVTDPDARNDLLFDGELDALQTTNPASVGDLSADGSVQNVIDETGEESFAMINSGVAPFDDIRAREALARATPLENYRNLIGLGVSSPADQRYTESDPFFNPDVVQVGDDTDAALALVAQYCGERGAEENTVLAMPTCTDGRINMQLQWSGPAVIQTRIAELLDEGWSAGGFNVSFDELPQDDHIQQAALGQYNVVTWRQFGATDASSDNVWLLCRTVGAISLNWPRFCDEERDALLLEGQTLENGPDRAAIYQEVERKINEDYVYIFFLHTKWDNAFAEKVRGQCDRVGPGGEALRCVGGGVSYFDSVYLTS